MILGFRTELTDRPVFNHPLKEGYQARNKVDRVVPIITSPKPLPTLCSTLFTS